MAGLTPPSKFDFSQSPPRWAFYLIVWICSLLERLLDFIMPAPQRALQQAMAFIDSQVIFTCARLGIAEALERSTKSAAQLSKELGIEEEALTRLLLAAAQTGFFKITRKDNCVCFKNTKLSLVLHRDHPNQLKHLFGVQGDESSPALLHLEHAIRTAADPSAPSAWAKYSGMEMWEYFAANPALQDRFSKGMRAVDGLGARSLVEDHKWGKYNRILDIGGASGSFLAQILQQTGPNTTGVVCDLQSVIKVTQATWETSPELSSIAQRVSFAEIDFFKPGDLPKAQDGDCFLMRNILHDWSDSDSLAILRNLRAAIGNAEATLAIVEMSLVGNERSPLAAARRKSDLIMMCMLRGKERSPDQWEALLSCAGFRLSKIVHTRTPFTITIAKCARTTEASS